MLKTNKQVLVRIAEAFCTQEILWALGGVTLLACSGIDIEAERLDLIIDSADIAKVDLLLSAWGEAHPRVPSPRYASRFYCRYTIEGADVHVMSGLVLRDKGFLYTYRFDRETIASMLPVENVYIPCTALEDWYILYQMMPWRETRVKALREYFLQNGVARPERFAAMRRHQPLPPAVLASIYELSQDEPIRA